MTLSSPQRRTDADVAEPSFSIDNTRAVLQRVALHLQAGRRQAAAEELRLLSPLDVVDAAQCRLIGSILCGGDALPEALAWFARAFSLAPEDFPAAASYATILFQLGRLEEALSAYDIAVRLGPANAQVFYNRGLVLHNLGRTSEAITSLDEALKLEPGDPDTLRLGGLILRDADRLGQALAFFEEALRLRPDFQECSLDRANLLQRLGRFEDAIAAYDEGLARFPNDADLLNNRGAAWRELGDLDAALACFEAAIAARPNFPQAIFNRSTMLLKRAPQVALASYDAALALRPLYADAHVGRGVALKELGRFDEAQAAFDMALALEPDSAHARNNKGALQLLRGDFANGLEGYEYRWLASGLYKKKLTFPVPEWRLGETKRVLVYDEQGFGDTFQFSRYLPLLADTGADVTFLCRNGLVSMIGRIDPRVPVVETFSPSAVYAAQIALSSLPRAFGTRLDTIPAPRAYLKADPKRVAAWHEQIGGEGFKIGLCWQGNSNPRADPSRSIPLAAFAPLASLPGLRLISLQTAEFTEAAAESSFGIEVVPDLDSGPEAFADTAAIIQNLDLIVTCDTSIAHLAGGLGRPVFVALRQIPDWRWQLDRADSPWYPTMRLFRQTERGNWDASRGGNRRDAGSVSVKWPASAHPG
jgi:tetratricopeptide (TPR) repeat protein